MADIKSMPADEIAKILGIAKDSESFTKIMQIIADQGTVSYTHLTLPTKQAV